MKRTRGMVIRRARRMSDGIVRRSLVRRKDLRNVCIACRLSTRRPAFCETDGRNLMLFGAVSFCYRCIWMAIPRPSQRFFEQIIYNDRYN